MQLNIRDEEILLAIIEAYITSGEPIGSRTLSLSKENSNNLSAASIRNIMSDLSEGGYLEQNHSSSGRVPSDEGLRFYVNHLLKANLDYYHPFQYDQEYVNTVKLDDLLKDTIKYISEKSNLTSIISTPQSNNSVLNHFKFIRLNLDQVIAVIVTKAGIVFNKMIQISQEVQNIHLESLSNYLNNRFEGRNLNDIRNTLIITLEKADDEIIVNNRAQFIRLSKKAFEITEKEKLYFYGSKYILNLTDHVRVEEVERIYDFLENPEDLIYYLNGSHHEDNNVQVSIGKEHEIETLSKCAIIYSQYGTKERALGAIGILGPKRIEYIKIIPMVKKVADMLSDKITNTISK